MMVWRIKNGVEKLVNSRKAPVLTYEKDNKIERYLRKENEPVQPSHIGRAWASLHREVLYDLNDKKYSDQFIRVKEDDIKVSEKIAYDPIVYKSFKQRCIEATNNLEILLNHNHK